MAYPYVKPDVLRFFRERRDEMRLLIDSGAFTAWKAGKTIALDDYCRFIESLPVTPWRYFTLDVVGDPKGTLSNYETMRKRGFKPVPIFTRGEDPSLLDEYYKTSDVVGIGGLVGTCSNKGFVKGIMRKVNGRKVHWLGFTNLAYLKVFKPYMADSSTWEMGARYASCSLYLGRGLPLIQIMKPKLKAQLRNPQILAAIESYGFNPNDLLKPENWKGGRSITRRMGARSMRRLSDDVATHIGTHLFLAAATKYAAELLLEET
jgi:hypothetical protein